MAGKEQVKLLGFWSSPYALRVEVALKLKGIEYESVEENIANKSPQLLMYNPVYKKIPVLLHNGNPICESLIIVEYIDETWKHNPILPQDPYERAIARFWAHFADDKLGEAVKAIFDTSEEEEKQKAAEKAREALQVIEEELRTRSGMRFFGGDTIGFVDIAIAWIPTWLQAVERTANVTILDPHKFPLLQNWIHNLLQVAVIRETLPPLDNLVQLINHVVSSKLVSQPAK